MEKDWRRDEEHRRGGVVQMHKDVISIKKFFSKNMKTLLLDSNIRVESGGLCRDQ